MSENAIRLNGTDIPIFLVGDQAYTLYEWLMKPFPFNGSLSQAQRSFNYYLSCFCIVTENAFERLKARWRRLYKHKMNINNVSCIIIACCILHNIFELHNDSLNESWLEKVDLNNHQQPSRSPIAGSNANQRATIIRNALVQYFV